MSKADIVFKGMEGVGSITFMQPTSAFPSYRTASGFRIDIPASIRFVPPHVSQAPLTLENLSVILFAPGNKGEKEIGVAYCEQTLTTGTMELPIRFSLDLTLDALAFYERLRDGQEPKFRMRVSGAISYVLQVLTNHQVRSISFPYYADCHVQYSRDAWTKTLRELDFRDCILLEIPFPSDPPHEWEAVWHALRDARDSFESGGSTGWKSSITSVRLALEEWRNIEKEDQGAGWQMPKIPDLQSRSKEQRLNAIRWHLIQLAHDAAHTNADEWTRDDALLMVSTLCALLRVRNP